MSTPMEEDILDLTGPGGETLLTRPLAGYIESPPFNLQAELDDAWEKYKDIEDERLLALVGALCTELALDRFIISYCPGFSHCISKRDFTFSVKTNIARSFKIIPARIFTGCDLVRGIRNEFAHNLDVKCLSDVSDKLLRKISPQLGEFQKYDWASEARSKQFTTLVGFVTCALGVYRGHVQIVREFLEAEGTLSVIREWQNNR